MSWTTWSSPLLKRFLWQPPPCDHFLPGDSVFSVSDLIPRYKASNVKGINTLRIFSIVTLVPSQYFEMVGRSQNTRKCIVTGSPTWCASPLGNPLSWSSKKNLTIFFDLILLQERAEMWNLFLITVNSETWLNTWFTPQDFSKYTRKDNISHHNI